MSIFLECDETGVCCNALECIKTIISVDCFEVINATTDSTECGVSCCGVSIECSVCGVASLDSVYASAEGADGSFEFSLVSCLEVVSLDCLETGSSGSYARK